jgi:predicted flap endonuclease-1-like 5' DNA nuclease
MDNDGRSPAKTCACCGQQVSASGRLALSVEIAVLEACNRAYAEAERRGDGQVEEAHLLVCLAREARSIQMLWQFGLAASELLAAAENWLSRHGLRGNGEQIQASVQLKALLARAEARAVRERRTHASLHDLVATIAEQRGHHARNPVQSATTAQAEKPSPRAFLSTPTTTAPPAAARATFPEWQRPDISGRGKIQSADTRSAGTGDTDDASIVTALLSRLEQQETLLAELRAAVATISVAAADSIDTGPAGGEGTGGRKAAARRRQSSNDALSQPVRHALTYRPDVHVLSTASTPDRLYMRLSLRRRREHSLRRRNRSAPAPGLKGAAFDRDLRICAEQAVTRARGRLRARDHRAHDGAPSPFRERDSDLAGADEGGKRFFLALEDPIERAPSIGAKTATRLSEGGVVTVRDLLAADPETLAARVRTRHITAQRLRDWQAQARLVCTVPWLRGTHAQLLVGAGYASLDRITAEEPSTICSDILKFATTRDGQSVLRSGPPPDMERILKWVENTALAEPDRAAA